MAFRVVAGRLMRGRVVDDAGRPVEHAEIWVSPWQSGMSAASDRRGRFAIPVDANLVGAKVRAQWFVRDGKSPNLALIGGGAATGGAELLIGR